MKKFVQFIAGAICPNCKSNDTIALNPEDDQTYENKALSLASIKYE